MASDVTGIFLGLRLKNLRRNRRLCCERVARRLPPEPACLSGQKGECPLLCKKPYNGLLRCAMHTSPPISTKLPSHCFAGCDQFSAGEFVPGVNMRPADGGNTRCFMLSHGCSALLPITLRESARRIPVGIRQGSGGASLDYTCACFHTCEHY